MPEEPRRGKACDEATVGRQGRPRFSRYTIPGTPSMRPCSGIRPRLSFCTARGHDPRVNSMCLQTERTAANALVCAFCRTPMTGRRPQARYCSDACRACGGRQDRNRRLASLLDTITRAVDALRQELDLSVAD